MAVEVVFPVGVAHRRVGAAAALAARLPDLPPATAVRVVRVTVRPAGA